MPDLYVRLRPFHKTAQPCRSRGILLDGKLVTFREDDRTWNRVRPEVGAMLRREVVDSSRQGSPLVFEVVTFDEAQAIDGEAAEAQHREELRRTPRVAEARDLTGHKGPPLPEAPSVSSGVADRMDRLEAMLQTIIQRMTAPPAPVVTPPSDPSVQPGESDDDDPEPEDAPEADQSEPEAPQPPPPPDGETAEPVAAARRRAMGRRRKPAAA
jgi:hypothetical protein